MPVLEVKVVEAVSSDEVVDSVEAAAVDVPTVAAET